MTNYINSRSRRGVPLRPAEEIPIVDGRAGAGRGPDGMTSYISRNTRGVPPAEEVPIVDGQPVAPAGEFTRRAKATRLNLPGPQDNIDPVDTNHAADPTQFFHPLVGRRSRTGSAQKSRITLRWL